MKINLRRTSELHDEVQLWVRHDFRALWLLCAKLQISSPGQRSHCRFSRQLGRTTALRKPSGGVRGILVRDVLRRLVGRTSAQHFAKKAETATAPFQYALSTPAGCECVSHALPFYQLMGSEHSIWFRKEQFLKEAYMWKGVTVCHFSPVNFTGLLQRFCGRMSWGSHVQQGEGGEQGDPIIPMLFALGQHSALVAISERLQELLFAFHDDLHIKSSPNRAVECSHILCQELWRHCRISLNNGKTRLWNRAGLFPQGCEVLEDAARRDDPEAVVWKSRVAPQPTRNQDLGSTSWLEGVCRARA